MYLRFSINNYFNTEKQKKLKFPTTVLNGVDSRNLVYDFVKGNQNYLIIVDQSFENDSYVNGLSKHSLHEKLVIKKEPTTEFIDKAVGKQESTEWLIAVGGGSTIDTAKAISAYWSFGTYREFGYKDTKYTSDNIVNIKSPKIVAIPTTAGTGSEVSRYYLISDENGKKLVSRSWSICPDYALLDPYFLFNSPKSLLVLSAFDAFVHLLETAACRFESSHFVQMLAREGISTIIDVLQKMNKSNVHNPSDLEKLQIVATYGGIAISNTRTGFLHDAGESLASRIRISHPLSLYIFFDQSFFLYENILINRLSKSLSNNVHIDDLPRIWRVLFEENGILTEINTIKSKSEIEVALITETIMQDKVLVEKECPITLDEEMVNDIIIKSLTI